MKPLIDLGVIFFQSNFVSFVQIGFSEVCAVQYIKRLFIFILSKEGGVCKMKPVIPAVKAVIVQDGKFLALKKGRS